MQFSTLSRLLLAVSIMALAMPSHATNKLTESQIESGINNQIDYMKDNGAFTHLAACSGKTEATIIQGYRNFLNKCAKTIDIQDEDDNQYDICVNNGAKSVLEMTDAQLDDCYSQLEDE
ncbi:hypothetical protein [Shewanella putrefaciens]|jgi:uncharacterized glyoxalase superfamily protein PhnB|uniref:hypothetical protein n=1 Tax=Shewanella putrefaciens TaxID=24 RepID=UPI00014B9A77|nr:hypothetical protein SHEWT2_00604 [Shewanella hafniensis]